MNSSTLGERIQQLRTKNGYSQEMLASSLGVSRQCISHYESNRRVPDLRSLLKIADTFGVPVDTFVSLIPKKENSPYLVKENNMLIGIHPDELDFTALTPMEIRLLEYFRQCSDEGREQILALAKEKSE